MQDPFNETLHPVLHAILSRRSMAKITANTPLWKLKLTDVEYADLRQTLCDHSHCLSLFGVEAALCYAYWWLQDYRGDIPSKLDVAIGLGLPGGSAEDLYLAARKALQHLRYDFIPSSVGRQYFRTLLSQGGLPVNYIKNKRDNLNGFSRFLRGLVGELTAINPNWNDPDHSFITRMPCFTYLPPSFRNESIYDVSMQIAHAIIAGDNDLLPYDETDGELDELTQSLRREYSSSQSTRRARPISLSWKLLLKDGNGKMFITFDPVKNIAPDAIPGLDVATCYAFDIFVSGILMGKYVRKTAGEDGETVYTRISLGSTQSIVWQGEQVVEVKVRCDNGERIFITPSGSYPPNFCYPQVFHQIGEDSYSQSPTDKAEQNIVVHTPEWTGGEPLMIAHCGLELRYSAFTDSLRLTNGCETLDIANTYTPYTAEFSGNYIPWVEDSNYKLLTSAPMISVLDENKTRVGDGQPTYHFRTDADSRWYRLRGSRALPSGLIDIKVEFPDGHSVIETFYSVGNMSFRSRKESETSTEIKCVCDSSLHVEIEQLADAVINDLPDGYWRISKAAGTTRQPSLASFRVYKDHTPVLRITVALRFKGTMIIDASGNILPDRKVISAANLTHYFMVSHDTQHSFRVYYKSDNVHLKAKALDGHIPLADYGDLITRIRNLHGDNTFDRTSAVAMQVGNKEIYIRQFVLESTIEDGLIRIVDSTDRHSSAFSYRGSVWALPVGENLVDSDYEPVELVREGDNVFTFPDDFTYGEAIVFSGPEAPLRIIPKYYDRDGEDFSRAERAQHASRVTNSWKEYLATEDLENGEHWRILCHVFDVCCRFQLPFATFNGLKIVAGKAELLAQFVMAIYLNNHGDVFKENVERYEQEMAVALHWLPAKAWEQATALPPELMNVVAVGFVSFLRELFEITLSEHIAQDFATYAMSGNVAAKGERLNRSELNEYMARMSGQIAACPDMKDLVLPISGQMQYYTNQDIKSLYRCMIHAAICAAENACDMEGHTNLFSHDWQSHARAVNFYRHYFKEVYSDIFIRTINYINTKTRI